MPRSIKEKEGDHRRSMTRHAEYKRNAHRTMSDMNDRLTRARMDEIKEVVAAKAKEAGYDIVLNCDRNHSQRHLYRREK